MKKYRDHELLNTYCTTKDLKDVLTTELKEISAFHEFKKGELLCELGDNVEYFYILLTGKVKVYTTSSDGKVLSLRIFDRMINLGDIELMTGTDYRCSVEALTDALCLAFPIREIHEKGLKDCNFLNYLCRDLCIKFDDIASVSSGNILYPLRNRLVVLLMETYDEASGIIGLPYTYKEIAELLGTTYRHLSRSINELETLGVIKVLENSIEVRDAEALKEMNVNLYPHRG